MTFPMIAKEFLRLIAGTAAVWLFVLLIVVGVAV